MEGAPSRVIRPCGWHIFFGTSAEFWLNLQSLYELRLAQKKAGKSIRALPRLERRDLVRAEAFSD
jgi:plasmid maintenance system antidote protein VapI